MRMKPICEDFSNNLEDGIEKTYDPEFIDQRSILFLRNESNQCIIKISEIYSAIVELGERRENILLNKIPKFLKKYDRKSIRARGFFGTKFKNGNSSLLFMKGALNVSGRPLIIWIKYIPICMQKRMVRGAPKIGVK